MNFINQKTNYMKKIGIIGSGDVGKSLANGFIKHGYEVMIGSRDTSKLNEWKEKGSGNGLAGDDRKSGPRK